MEDDLNGRQPQWKTASMEDNLANFVMSLAQLSPSLFCLFVNFLFWSNSSWEIFLVEVSSAQSCTSTEMSCAELDAEKSFVKAKSAATFPSIL